MTIAAIRNGWSSDNSTDDECDAWWLWAIGNALGGNWVVECTLYRSAVIVQLETRAAA